MVAFLAVGEIQNLSSIIVMQKLNIRSSIVDEKTIFTNYN
jgi:hypothetical protein